MPTQTNYLAQLARQSNFGIWNYRLLTAVPPAIAVSNIQAPSQRLFDRQGLKTSLFWTNAEDAQYTVELLVVALTLWRVLDAQFCSWSLWHLSACRSLF